MWWIMLRVWVIKLISNGSRGLWNFVCYYKFVGLRSSYKFVVVLVLNLLLMCDCFKNG